MSSINSSGASDAPRGSGADPRRWKALALVCTATFMVILDAQIVILALPSIESALDFSPGSSQWVLSSYLLAFGGLLLVGGRAADLLGRRRTFMAGVVLFLLSSLACGLASVPSALIAARVVQGVSAAIMAPTALSIVMYLFDEGPERNKALGIWSGVGGVGATAALLVGGTLTDGLGWAWIFFINLPIAAVMLLLSPVLLPESRGSQQTRSIDLPGAVTVTLAMVLLVYALVEGPEAGWLSVRTVTLLIVSALSFALFIRIESRAAAPLVPLQIFRSRMVTGGNLVMLFLGTIAFGMSFVISLYAQQVLGYSALTFGLGTVVMTLMTVAGSYTGQALVSRFGLRWIGTVGMLLAAAGCFALTQVSVDGTYFGDIFLGLLIFGPGLGATYVAASIAALTDVAENVSGLASGLNTAAFQVGGALGVAITSTVVISSTVGADPLAALTQGFRAGFIACVVLALAGGLLALVLFRRTHDPERAMGRPV